MPDKVLADRETQEGQVKSLRNGRHIVTRPAFRNLAIAAEQKLRFSPTNYLREDATMQG